MAGELKFNAWSRKRINNGTKRITSRREAHSDPRVDYIVGPLPWRFIRDQLYIPEGAESPKELQSVINGIFRRTVRDGELFLVHVLKEGITV